MLLRLFVCVECFRKAEFLQGWLKIVQKTEDNALLWSLQVDEMVSILQSHPCSVSIAPPIQTSRSQTPNWDLVLTMDSFLSFYPFCSSRISWAAITSQPRRKERRSLQRSAALWQFASASQVAQLPNLPLRCLSCLLASHPRVARVF